MSTPAKARVRAKYPKAYRRTVWRHARLVHEIVVPQRQVNIIIAEGLTSAEAWENAQAYLLAEVLTR